MKSPFRLWGLGDKEGTRVSLYKRRALQKAVLVCPGPSLNKIDIDLLKGPGKTVFGVNTSYPAVKPDVWIGSDNPRCFDRHLGLESFMKITRYNTHNRVLQGFDLWGSHATYTVDVKKGPAECQLYALDKEIDGIHWPRQTFPMALDIIVHMGFKDIYIAGCDLSNDKKDYFHEETLDKENKRRNNNCHTKNYEWLKRAVEDWKRADIALYSLSPNSRINDIMPFVTVPEMNKEVERILPEQGPLYNSINLSDIRNKGGPKKSKVIMDKLK